MTWMRLPFFCWAAICNGVPAVIGVSSLEAAGVMQLMDKVAHTSFFLAKPVWRLVVILPVSGGGSPLPAVAHLFWFLVIRRFTF